MNSINNSWDSTKWTETPYFIAVPQVRTKMREKCKREKNKQINKKTHENE